MRLPDNWQQFLFESGVIPLTGLVMFILNSLSSFEYAESLKNKPEYKYVDDSENNYSDYSVTEVKNSTCSVNWTKQLVEDVNRINSSYVYGLFVTCFVINLVFLIVDTVKKIVKYYLPKDSDIIKAIKKLTGGLNYLSIVFSVPALYATKIKYDKCLKLEGLMNSYFSPSAYIVSNFGMWCSITLPIYYGLRNRIPIPYCTCCGYLLCIMWIYAAIFMGLALFAKYSTVVDLQLGWDLFLTLDGILSILDIRSLNQAKISSIGGKYEEMG